MEDASSGSEAGGREPEQVGLRRLVTPEEREHAIARLSTAFAGDVLPMEEFERRAAEVYRAATHGALAELTADLPAEAPEPRDAVRTISTRITSVLSNVERGGTVAIPDHLDIRAVCGNVELDLRDARFGRDVTEIAITAVCGNVEILLPHDVAVENRGGALLGSFAVRATSHAAGSAGTVRVTGRALLGNVEIRSAASGEDRRRLPPSGSR